ncbi:MAG: hypothetical protein JW876_11635 [Candidatus Krumholzibacteriota bacterium]|nr:hypothetical protein [Candidatus Krumholzibacteriota bacterium]
MRIVHVSAFAAALLAAAPFSAPSPADEVPMTAAAIHAELETGATALMTAGCATSGCHAGRFPRAGLDLSAGAFPASVVGAPSRKAEGRLLVDPADPAASYLMAKIVGEEGIVGDRMPDDAPPMAEADVRLLRLWICGVHVAAGGGGR